MIHSHNDMTTWMTAVFLIQKMELFLGIYVWVWMDPVLKGDAGSYVFISMTPHLWEGPKRICS